MRNFGFTSLAALLAASSPMPTFTYTDFRAPKRRKTGKRYPFASKRQNARYARQVASGQIRNAKAEA